MFSKRNSVCKFFWLVRFFITAGSCSIICFSSNAQELAKATDTSEYLTLKECIGYALIHQPALNRSLLNISIAKATNAVNLSGFFPQVSIEGTFTHYIELPTSFFSDTSGASTAPVRQRVGVVNTFTPEIYVSQAIFSPSLIYALRSAPLYVKQANQITDSTKINVVATVSKAFYNLLLTLEQINVLREDTLMLRQSVEDTYHQYVGGIVDETDNDQAIITLNNSRAQLKQADNNVIPEYATLKQLMGFPPEKQFNVSFDTLEMMNDIYFDTTQQLQFSKRIELQLINTTRELQHQTTRYYQYSFLPTVSAYYGKTFEYENNTFGKLFSNNYPNSLIGISLDMPIFTGFARIHNLQRSKLEERVIGWNETEEKSQIYTEYTTALADYKSDLYNLQTLQDNVALAEKVNFIVNLQYKQGLVAYLNLITAQTNLITAQINYTNALFQVLSSKIDLQKAMGMISY
jgi:multidrug efflux system outer membrane protein